MNRSIGTVFSLPFEVRIIAFIYFNAPTIVNFYFEIEDINRRFFPYKMPSVVVIVVIRCKDIGNF